MHVLQCQHHLRRLPQQDAVSLGCSARLSNQFGRSSPPMLRQKRFELIGPIVSSAEHAPLVSRVVRSKVFSLLQKKAS